MSLSKSAVSVNPALVHRAETAMDAETSPTEGEMARSGQRLSGRSWLLLGVIRVGTVLFLLFSLLMLLHPHPWEFLGFKPSGTLSDSALKISHIIDFTLLGTGFELGRLRQNRVGTILFLVALAWGTEILQIYTGRCFEWLDLVQDGIGIVLGTFLGMGFRKFPLFRWEK